MKKNLLFFIFIIIFFPKNTFGCDCFAERNFCDLITSYRESLIPIYILRGEVTETLLSRKEVKISQELSGTVSLEEITLGINSCTYHFSEFKEGKEYVFAVEKSGDTYYPLGCGVWYLELEDGELKGDITSGVTSIQYHELGNLEGCGNDLNLTNLEKDLDIFPNPALAVVNIGSEKFSISEEELTLTIYDGVGRKVQPMISSDGILAEESWVINIENFPVGLYLFEVNGLNQKKTFKIIKQ